MGLALAFSLAPASAQAQMAGSADMTEVQQLRTLLERANGTYTLGLPASVDVPLPPNTKVIGAVEGFNSWQVYADSALTPEQIDAFYSAQTGLGGWELLESATQYTALNVGFLPSARELAEKSSNVLLRRSPLTAVRWYSYPLTEDGATSASANGEAQTALAISLSTGEQAKWQAEQVVNGFGGAERFLPALSAPAGVDIMNTGGGGNDEWYSHEAEMSGAALPDMAAHYARQLTAQGWEPLYQSGGGHNAAVYHSLWRHAANTVAGSEFPARQLLLKLSPSADAAVRAQLYIWPE